MNIKKLIFIFFATISFLSAEAEKLSTQNTSNNVITANRKSDCNQVSILMQKPEWVSKPKAKVKDIYRELFFSENKRIKQDKYYEVSLQAMYIVNDLKNEPVIELSYNAAKAITSGHYKTVKGKKAYLVRAVFSNATGLFTVDWDKNKKILMISHGSLGGSSSSPIWALPLVVNLEHKPKQVYVVLDSAS